MNPDPGRIRDQLCSLLAEATNLQRPDAVKSIRETIEGMGARSMVDYWMEAKFGTTDISLLDDGQLREVYTHVMTIADVMRRS